MRQIIFCFLILASVSSLAQKEEALRTKQFNLQNGVAISGYDPVAYFSQHKAIKGKADISETDKGVTYYFSSLNDKEEFKKNPSKYEPQYGGWCAYAMGKDGDKVEVDPETFKIVEGKLFLFYNKFFNNTLKSWNKDEGKLHQQADANWTKFYH